MSNVKIVVGDGSSAADAREIVEVDRVAEPYRWTCPGQFRHTNWYQTNNHIWCAGCRQIYENGVDVDPEYHEIVDLKTGEKIPWSSVRLIEPELDESRTSTDR